MKTLKLLFFIPVMALFLVSCNDGQSNQSDQQEHSMEMHDGDHEGHKVNQDGKMDGRDKTGPEYTSDYVCPMHCEGSGSDEPGKCPVCGMEYVKNEEG